MILILNNTPFGGLSVTNLQRLFHSTKLFYTFLRIYFMAYIINIPNEAKEALKEIVLRNKNSSKWNYNDFIYAVKIYYRFVKRIQDMQAAIEMAIGCGTCRKEVQQYFIEESKKW